MMEPTTPQCALSSTAHDKTNSNYNTVFMFGERLRYWMTEWCLGLTGPPRKAHAVMNMTQFGDMQQYIKSLCRSARCTMKRIHKVEEKHEVRSWNTVAGKGLGWNHWRVFRQQ